MGDYSDDQTCPDGGYCGHACAFDECYRVRACGPLPGVYEGDEWPVRVRLALSGRPADHLIDQWAGEHGASDAARRVLRALLDWDGPAAPTVRELCAASGVVSPSTVHSHLHALAALGFVDWTPGHARTLRVTVPPPGRPR